MKCYRGRCVRASTDEGDSDVKSFGEIWLAGKPAQAWLEERVATAMTYLGRGNEPRAVREVDFTGDKEWDDGRYAAMVCGHGHHPKFVFDLGFIRAEGNGYGDPERFLNQIIVHEVLHLIRYAEEQAVEDAVEGPLREVLTSIQHQSLEDQAGVLVDHIFPPSRGTALANALTTRRLTSIGEHNGEVA